MQHYQEQQRRRPPQHQPQQPGREHDMWPEPIFIREDYIGSDKLKDKVALITGGDSGIGRAVALHFAREGADSLLVYLGEHEDARETQRLVLSEGRRCELLAGDVGDPEFCAEAVAQAVKHYGRLDVLVNNAAEQHEQTEFTDISFEQVERTFKTNFFAYFALAKAALPHLGGGGAIVNTTSITAYRGSSHLIDYSATKGAIVAFTRSLAKAVADKGIRVNGVAPGPIWTPLIPATFPKDKVEQFGGNTPMGRAGQPAECAPAYVFLASADGSYMTGQILHPNGGSLSKPEAETRRAQKPRPIASGLGFRLDLLKQFWSCVGIDCLQ
ncbi:NAD(P)-dependent oxidoreductase [Alkalilimnicola ehrlichii]|uniref:NAD(P)-dependent oxidoreductase n=1 Tax=Alkalilimnicola ehrlichii TaxID=351052 RepID=A0A3E0X1Q1_9GAMM|nr:SDR family oxidoreductase [Alkalilimnicola ehrlichii]RFA30539.1 NAD(P)-dependent oxidoreductase [Alkalilimnicola ehrlichii]RFA38087.1 NAD(P)-dependent oxidoreductase [Alkalilimnicola ehrlichii]